MNADKLISLMVAVALMLALPVVFSTGAAIVGALNDGGPVIVECNVNGAC